MPAACTRICTSSSTGSPISISSTRNGELSSHSRAPFVFMTGDHRTRYKTRVKKAADVHGWRHRVRRRCEPFGQALESTRPSTCREAASAQEAKVAEGPRAGLERSGQTERLEGRHV